MMTVKQLRDRLANLPEDMEVIMQKDAEGNGYSPLSELDDNCIYLRKNSWAGAVYGLDWTADDACMDEGEWENVKASKPRVLVLCPVN